jgi:phage terminase large subunit-like protein
MKSKTGSRNLSEEETNWLLVYHNAIQSGEETVGNKVRTGYAILVADMLNSDADYEYSLARANHAVSFIENYCRHSKGASAGKLMELELWEKAYISATFGFVWKSTGWRRFQTVLLIIGRKNGKSTLSAAIGLYLLAGDGEMGAEIYSAATKKDQAKIIWLEARRMILKSPALRKRFKCLVGEIAGKDSTEFFGCTWKPLGSDSDRQDGLNVHGALMDEIHAWPDKALYDVIVDGESSRDQPLTVITTTAGFTREGLYDSIYADAEGWLAGIDGYRNPTFLPIIYELDYRDEWTDPSCWAKANPGLGTIKKIDKLASKVEDAKHDEKKISNLLTKEFNLPAAESESWLPFEVCVNKQRFELSELAGCYAIGGVDLSSVHDLTCATLMAKKRGSPTIYVLQKYFIPESVAEAKVKEDGVRYDIWEKQGWVKYSGTSAVDYTDVTEWFIEMRDTFEVFPLWIGFDRYMAPYWLKEMAEHGFSKPQSKTDEHSVLQEVIQGALTMSQPMKLLAAEFKAGNINFNGNPILSWCLANTRIQVDVNDNIRPVKGRANTRRIDGVVSLIDAFVIYCKNRSRYENLT